MASSTFCDACLSTRLSVTCHHMNLIWNVVRRSYLVQRLYVKYICHLLCVVFACNISVDVCNVWCVICVLMRLCAFKGICAQEIHLCGEESGIEFIRHIAMVTGDDMEVRKYKRLTSLMVLDRAVGKTLAVATGYLLY